MTKISVIMPLYNGKTYIKECIESIQNQTFTDWEFIIVNEWGSDDGSAEIVEEYLQADNRITLLQNTKRLGLADSLNAGIKIATGEYIARVDVDDPSYPSRFEKQVAFLDKNPDIVLCGSKQRSVTATGSNIQEVPCEPEELKAGLLFGCEISHCSVMFRREVFVNNNWWYNAAFLGEDYELWTRVLRDKSVKMANIPEPLVDHRWGFGNISIEKGERLRQEVRELSARFLSHIGVEVSEEDMLLLSGWRDKPTDYAKANIGSFLQKGYALLETIRTQNKKAGCFDEKALGRILDKRWDWICQSCELDFLNNREKFDRVIEKPAVTVLLPIGEDIFNLRRCIDSVLIQNIKEIELYVIYDAGIQKGLKEIVEFYEKQDTRIKLIKSDKEINRAIALNMGINVAKGEYITSITSYDIFDNAKFTSQIELFKNYAKVGACCTGSEDLTIQKIHVPPKNSDHIKAALMFGDAFNASTLMVKREVLVKNNLHYDEALEETDFDFLVKLTEVTNIVGIEDVLSSHYEMVRFGEENHYKRFNEMWKIFLRNLDKHLNMTIKEADIMLLKRYGFFDFKNKNKKLEEYKDCLKTILCDIYQQNNNCQYYDTRSLLRTLDCQWRKNLGDWNWAFIRNIYCLEQIFDNEFAIGNWKKTSYILTDDISAKRKIKYIFKGGAKKILSPLYRVYRRYVLDVLFQHVNDMTWDRYELIKDQIDDLHNSIMALRNYSDEANYILKRNMLIANKKIRIVFLFQIPSFWPSWESFYHECINDERFDVKFVLLDETNTEISQMQGAQEFLERKKIDYIVFEELNLEEFAPHVLVYQSPYDKQHRQYHTWSESIKRLGIRVVYIPYGIEIADTEQAHTDHFNAPVPLNCWRLYTFSSVMKHDYDLYFKNKDSVRALGHPKFDPYFKGEITPDQDLVKLVANRKVVMWKVHFPKLVIKDGFKTEYTPEISEYYKFVDYIKTKPDLFFIFMPHPKFLDNYGVPIHLAQKLISDLTELENVYIDRAADYRKSLSISDYIMVDRSAVMVEAATFGVPVLYMSNIKFQEPITKAIKPLINSYYQGGTCKDMIKFVEMCIEGKDPKRELRHQAFKQCFPCYDGKCGLRIKEDIVQSLRLETEVSEGNQKMYYDEINNKLQGIGERLAILEEKDRF